MRGKNKSSKSELLTSDLRERTPVIAAQNSNTQGLPSLVATALPKDKLAGAPASTAESVPVAPWQTLLSHLKHSARPTPPQLAQGSRTAQTPSIHYLVELFRQTRSVPTVRVHINPESAAAHTPWHQAAAQTFSQLDQRCADLKWADAHIVTQLLEANAAEISDYSRFFSPTAWKKIAGSKWDGRQDLMVRDDSPQWLMLDLIRSGRCFWRADPLAQPEPLPIKSQIVDLLGLHLVLSDRDSEHLELSLELRAGSHVVTLSEIVWVWDCGLILLPDKIGEVAAHDVAWIRHFLRAGTQVIPREQLDGVLQTLLELPNSPALVWPDDWDLREETGVPVPVLLLRLPKRWTAQTEDYFLSAEPSFKYGDRSSETLGPQQRFLDSNRRRIVTRDLAREQQLRQQLAASGQFKIVSDKLWQVANQKLAELPQQLAELGWIVEAEGRSLVAPSQFSLEVTSGIDWFDLSGGVKYADQIVPVPVLLQAIRRQENFVRLDDGTQGILPARWLEKFGSFLSLAQEHGESLRFGRSQALILDGLLADQDQSSHVVVDKAFRKLRQELTRFQGVSTVKAPASFQGRLRAYQEEGLGWFQFLQRFGFGGCLADDMGLGKTVQVLALLERRRTQRRPKGQSRKPSLVVVPKSLVFNWIDEAARFAPGLKVVDFTGIDRQSRFKEFAAADLILTTYGTLRNDIQQLASVNFDYAILDEAQAIKNPQTDAAKACYLLQADHRLVMTGTPIENHLGDLWSQFRFLNPGLLGHSEAFAAFHRGDCDQETLNRLSRAVRPFILRRTKQQVLRDLPPKTEKTIVCEMNARQARQYNELREHFRQKLDKTVKELGIQRSTIHVLEALLRLRQAACDGRLVNPQQGARGSKLDLVLEQVEELILQGKKTLIFSQFTSLLRLLQTDLVKRHWSHEYLDGATRNRQACVKRFQESPDCHLFLISLKAGGQGLNLTAAENVFILDPWWNPAVEAQAVDRAHRMGQKKVVLAQRIISRGTVEEKILELQKSKRTLAESIISGDKSLIRNLTADDLKLLLSR